MTAEGARQSVSVFIGLGANLGDATTTVLHAFESLAAIADTVLAETSSLYASRPMGPADQPDYVNAVARLDTQLAAAPLLDALQAIEAQHGRRRGGARWGARTLDLDLLLYGQQVIDTPRLRVPHAGIGQRDFVLRPLLELAPRLEVPGLGRADAALARLPASSLHIVRAP